jgi:hypothetical protein
MELDIGKIGLVMGNRPGTTRCFLCRFRRVGMHVNHGTGETIFQKAVVKHEPAISACGQSIVRVEIVNEDDAYVVDMRGPEVTDGQYRLPGLFVQQAPWSRRLDLPRLRLSLTVPLFTVSARSATHTRNVG